MREEHDCHESSIKCLTQINDDRFCSGGNDRYLRIWENNGELVGSIERQEEENLHCMLAISNNRVITGSNSSLLLVYRTDTLKFCQIFTYHRESVRCLAKINENMFASASLDGVIVVWQMESLTPLKRLSYPDKFVSIDQNRKFYAHAVNHLLVLNQTYLAACIGNGFQIFNISTGESVMQKSDAHESTVYCIISVSGGKRFLTCSADAQIKFWGNSNDFSFSEDNENLRQSKRKGSHNIQVVSLGEMWGHTDQVKTLLKLSETAFVSGGHDNLIILWRDGEEQSLIRNKCAAEAIRELQATLYTNHNSRAEANNHHRVSSLSLPNCNRTPPRAVTSDDSQGSGIWQQDTEGERDETDLESEEQDPVVPISYLDEVTNKKIDSVHRKESFSPRAVDVKYQTHNILSPRTIDLKYQSQNQYGSERDLK